MECLEPSLMPRLQLLDSLCCNYKSVKRPHDHFDMNAVQIYSSCCHAETVHWVSIWLRDCLGGIVRMCSCSDTHRTTLGQVGTWSVLGLLTCASDKSENFELNMTCLKSCRRSILSAHSICEARCRLSIRLGSLDSHTCSTFGGGCRDQQADVSVTFVP